VKPVTDYELVRARRDSRGGAAAELAIVPMLLLKVGLLATRPVDDYGD
jgi:hypothetical protein